MARLLQAEPIPLPHQKPAVQGRSFKADGLLTVAMSIGLMETIRSLVPDPTNEQG